MKKDVDDTRPPAGYLVLRFAEMREGYLRIKGGEARRTKYAVVRKLAPDRFLVVDPAATTPCREDD